MSVLSGLRTMWYGPAGTFTRSRRDMMHRGLITASSTGGGLAGDEWRMTVLNNDPESRYLALYGLFVNNPNVRGFDLFLQFGIDPAFGTPTPGHMNMPDQPYSMGVWAAGKNSTFGTLSDDFYPTGKQPFTLLTESPLYVIRVGYAITVASFNLANSADILMMWAPY